MKRARIINAIAWAIIAVAICIAVVIEWHHCEIKSLAIACTMYTAMAAGMGATIDQTIKETKK